jgi:uncharacterized protein YukE
MDEQLSVNTDGLLDAVPGINELADHVGNVLTNLQDKLGALGQPWGDDKTGQAFLAQYQGPRQKLESALANTQSVLRSTADGVETMAKGFAATEEQNQASIITGGEGSDGDTGHIGGDDAGRAGGAGHSGG